jgi:hypothetical protein
MIKEVDMERGRLEKPCSVRLEFKISVGTHGFWYLYTDIQTLTTAVCLYVGLYIINLNDKWREILQR